ALLLQAFCSSERVVNLEAFDRFVRDGEGRLDGVHFTLDTVGDVYLTDRLLGCVLTYSDENFDAALELGFGSAIRREWAWRVKRGESLANLQAFARFADPDR